MPINSIIQVTLNRIELWKKTGTLYSKTTKLEGNDRKMKISGAELVIRILESMGIDKVAGLPGGANLPLYNALYKSKIEHILAKHEQGAGFIAQGMTRCTGKVAVLLVTSGPGATNAITAIADAKLDSVPLVVITGQVPFSNIGKDSFQEVDTYSLTIPITKHNFLVRHIQDLYENLIEAFKIATEGRKGPVVVDIPKNVLNQEIEISENSFENLHQILEPQTHTHPMVTNEQIEKMIEMLQIAKKPVLYIGGGFLNANVCEDLIGISRKNAIPIVSTLMGLGCVPPDEPLYLGMLGMHGARYTNLVMKECDLLIALGVRFDDRATGKMEAFCKHASVIHVDIERAEINKNRDAHHFIVAHLDEVIPRFAKSVPRNQRSAWVERIETLKKEYPYVTPPVDEPYHSVNIMKSVAKILGDDVIVTTDVGQHQMWVAQVYPFTRPRQLLTSGGLGTMGFGLPAAIGASLIYPEKTIICFTGDASFFMNIQEMSLLKERNLNIKVILMNNQSLGMVRQQQELFYGQNYIASIYEQTTDFVAISQGFGVSAVRISEEADNIVDLEEALISRGPFLIECIIKQNANIYPIVPPGAGNDEMLGGDLYE